jgi:hypothetical protein
MEATVTVELDGGREVSVTVARTLQDVALGEVSALAEAVVWRALAAYQGKAE